MTNTTSAPEVALTLYNQPLGARMEYAKQLAGSQLLPKEYQRQPQNLLVAFEYGAALGLAPIEAVSSIHVIQGKPSMSADLMSVMVRRAGHKLRVKGDDTYAEATIIRADDPDYPMTARWDMQKASQAGLLSNPSWKKYPAAMLRARAISEVARMAASDALMGVKYTPEEIGATVAESGEPVHLEVQATPQDPSEWNRLQAEATNLSQQLGLDADGRKQVTLDALKTDRMPRNLGVEEMRLIVGELQALAGEQELVDAELEEDLKGDN